MRMTKPPSTGSTVKSSGLRCVPGAESARSLRTAFDLTVKTWVIVVPLGWLKYLAAVGFSPRHDRQNS
jgi:hypothetical protein